MKSPHKFPAPGIVSALIALAIMGSLHSPRATAQQPQQESNPASPKKSAPPLDDHLLSSALCSIVYQVDRDPGPRGYHYLFYGNGFFINRDGDLITAAHVLSQLHGGQPYLLLRVRSAAPRFVAAKVVAIDTDHDVAILRAKPNPFAGNFSVSFLNIDRAEPVTGERVLAAALRPFKPRDSYTLEPALEERSAGEVLNFQFSKLDPGAADTELFLFAHKIQPGQSGAPVLSLDSHEVVGFVEGQWLRAKVNGLAPAPKQPLVGPSLPPAGEAAVTPAPGAVIPIHYAIALLQANHVHWHTADEPAPDDSAAASENNETNKVANNSTNDVSPPVPYSLVPAPYPPQSLAGGEVLLDALVARTGTVSDIRVVSGQEPFLAAALSAVHSWTFVPAHSAGQAAEARVAIIFQFPNPYIPPRVAMTHHYKNPAQGKISAAAETHAALPTETTSPQYPAGTNTEGGSVILRESVDAAGRVTAIDTELEAKALTSAVETAARQWTFAPAQKSGTAIFSTVVLAVTFREPLIASAPAR